MMSSVIRPEAWRVDAVKAQEHVEVHRSACLVFGGFAVREADFRQSALAGLLVEIAFGGLLCASGETGNGFAVLAGSAVAAGPSS